MTAERLVIRADGSHRIGLGHVMRCLAYAECARDRGVSVVFELGGDPRSAGPLERRGFAFDRIPEPEDLSWIARVHAADIVLVDGYHFRPELLKAVSDTGATMVMIDDAPGIEHADVVIAPESDGALRHPTKPGALVLAGIEHAAIRHEFRRSRRLRDEPTDTRPSMVITLGGSDAAGVTEDVVRAAADAAANRFSSLEVVVGPMTPQAELTLEGPVKVRVHRDPPSVASVFDRCVAALSAAGTTAWELACMGVPAGLIEVSPGQAVVGPAMARAGAAICLGTVPDGLNRVAEAVVTLSEPPTRGQMSRAALAYVDGRGADRALDALFGSARSARTARSAQIAT